MPVRLARAWVHPVLILSETYSKLQVQQESIASYPSFVVQQVISEGGGLDLLCVMPSDTRNIP